MSEKGRSNLTFPPSGTSERGVLKPTVKRLYDAGVSPAEIRARGIAAGWTRVGVNRALRAQGYRERNYRDDLGIKEPLDSAKEVARILSHFPDPKSALEFLDEVRRRLLNRSR